MKKIEKVIIFWGVCDIAFFAIFTISSFARGEIPFYSNLIDSIHHAKIFFDGARAASWSFIAVTFLNIILYISLLISGVLLILRKRSGALLAYYQTPFRIAMVAPSLYFVLWLFGRLEISLWVGVPLVIFGEIAKIYTLMRWQRMQKI